MPDPTPPPAARCMGKYCRDCRGVRLNTVEVVPAAGTNRAVRVRRCSACHLDTPLGGICCPACGWGRLWVLYTRHPRAGCITRIRRCTRPGCGHKIRTVVRCEAMGA